jgi:quercetin dioxygenase-like cupin family protein
VLCYHEKIPKKDLGGGIIFQHLGTGVNMNVFHWNMANGSVVALHQHPEEQYGYVIRGGFEITINEEKYRINAGDAYFIPPDQKHAFTALGDTEAIDVFAPKKSRIPGES